MTKIKGFLSQDVTVTRKETPESEETTSNIPPEWIPLMEKIMKWFDNQQYAVFNPFFGHKTRSAKERNYNRQWLTEIKDAWNALAP